MPLVCRSGSRALGTGLLVLSLSVVAVLLAPSAHAQSADQNAATLRAEADASSSRYFAALGRVHALDTDIARNQQLVDDLLARAKKARADARARALFAYTTSGTQLSTLVNGADPLDAARRAHLINRVNERDREVYAALNTATRALQKQQRVLRATQQAQANALNELRDQGAAINAKLARAVQQEQAAAAPAAPAAATATATTAGTAATTSSVSTSTTTTTTQPPPPSPAPPPNYSGTPGTNPHHDDPFLSCVRLRESGGNYRAVNPAGPYLGAYQFLQATWNVTAGHAGRSDLLGVPANVATPYDQDEMAWALYQWQGKRPWGGSC